MQEISRIVHKSSMPEPLNKDFRRVAISRVPPMKEMVLNKSKSNRIIIIH